jgi:hypothetical protein
MYFGTESYLKSNYNHPAKHILRMVRVYNCMTVWEEATTFFFFIFL